MINYFLVMILSTTVVRMEVATAGPFHGLLACEKAASQMQIAAIEAGVRITTMCLSQKDANFKFKESK